MSFTLYRSFCGLHEIHDIQFEYAKMEKKIKEKKNAIRIIKRRVKLEFGSRSGARLSRMEIKTINDYELRVLTIF